MKAHQHQVHRKQTGFLSVDICVPCISRLRNIIQSSANDSFFFAFSKRTQKLIDYDSRQNVTQITRHGFNHDGTAISRQQNLT